MKKKTSGLKAWQTRKRGLVNSMTGKPRRWVCLNNNATDAELEVAEVINQYAGFRTMPLKLRRELLALFERRADVLRRCIEAEPPLTEAELSYCQQEGVDPKTYAEDKVPPKAIGDH